MKKVFKIILIVLVVCLVSFGFYLLFKNKVNEGISSKEQPTYNWKLTQNLDNPNKSKLVFEESSKSDNYGSAVLSVDLPDVEGKCEPYSINKNIGTSIDPKNLITLLSCKNDKSDDVYQIGHVIVGIGEKQYATFYERKVSVEKSLNTFDSFTEVKLKK